jgi:two-component system sensor histidine kinase QseC
MAGTTDYLQVATVILLQLFHPQNNRHTMTHSIRKFLLINLLLAMTVIISLTAIGNYYLDKQDIEEHLDNLLSQAGLSFTAIASRDIQHQNWKKLQARMDAVPAQAQKYLTKVDDENKPEPSNYVGKYRFQIWGPDHTLLLRSANSPTTMLSSGKFGFNDLVINKIHYRVFSNYDQDTNLIFIVAEPYFERDQLAHHIMIDDLYIMLLTYPLAGFLIWIIIGRGLRSLNQIAHALTKREPYYLESVNASDVPIEIQPLIKELNRLLHRLKAAFEREKRFAGDAAHELRTPLAAIRTQAQVASLVSSSPEQLAVMQNVILGVDRAHHIVNQLLAMGRLTPENEHFKTYQQCSLENIIQEVLMQLGPITREKGICIEFHHPTQSAMIHGNATALQILIRNLVDNAIRYTPSTGQININLTHEKENIALTIADNGPGIPEKFRERIFERFFRIFGNEAPGSGLGLSIVKQVADLHQATIVTTETDPINHTGFTITIRFPVVDLRPTN